MFHDTFYQNKYTFTLNSITSISLQRPRAKYNEALNLFLTRTWPGIKQVNFNGGPKLLKHVNSAWKP